MIRSCLLLFAVCLPLSSLPQSPTSKIDTSKYFEFHSNYWISLHHFLYQQAKGSQARHLRADGLELIDIGEDDIIQSLNKANKEALEEAIQYYRSHLIDKSLFRLVDLRVWLQEKDPDISLTDTTYSKEYKDVMNLVSPVYRQYLWPKHDAQNRKVYDTHKHLIRDTESVVIPQLEKLTGDEWPDTKIRVDLTPYANFAGAYTTTRPYPNSTISSLDPITKSRLFIEILIHEGTHLLFSRESPFRARIYHMSQEMDMTFPGNLWHASQFYLVGRSVQDYFRDKGIDYQLVMNVRNIFSGYNTTEFQEDLNRYYLGELDMEETIRNLLRHLN